MDTSQSTFNQDLKIENEISKWLNENYYSTDIFEDVTEVNESDLQHKGVDSFQKSHTIFKDRLYHAVDEKCAVRYVRKSHDEQSLSTFAFELNYILHNQLKDGWLYGKKYANTEYYQVMWLWANINKSGDWNQINKNNITKVEGVVIKKTVIRDYLKRLGFNQEGLLNYREKLQKSKKALKLNADAKILLSYKLPEQPMNVIISKKKLKELAAHHFVQEVSTNSLGGDYSRTRIIGTETNISAEISEITADIEAGIKNIVFSHNHKEIKEIIHSKYTDDSVADIENSILLEVVKLPERLKIKKAYAFKNGQIDINKWRTNIPLYNWDQYEIEHADYKKNISVKAGAGSGKTRTMIQRILYLVLHKGVSFNEIGMITFTNAAANEMKERIEDILFSRYKITKLPLYINLLESLNEINLSTIDSFSRDLIKEFSYKLGLGNNPKLTSYKFRKKQIIASYIDKYCNKEVKKILKENDLKHYEFIDEVINLWDKVLSLGIELADFENYQVTNDRDELLKKVIMGCSQILDEEKKKEGVLELSDLKFLSKRIVDNLTKKDLNNTQIKYLFVDEFQDTDNIQIDYIVKINEIFKSNLFIVGDAKQSIYRFRGAQHTAFKRIYEEIKDFDKYRLKINYRTSRSLLKDMNIYINNMYYLPQNELLKPFNTYDTNKIRFVDYDKSAYMNDSEDYASLFMKVFKKELDNLDKNTKLSILCRNNYEIDKIANILDGNGYKGKYESSKSGDLFKRTAAKDLAKFINLLLNHKLVKYHIAAITTPYFYEDISPIEMLRELNSHNSILDSEKIQKLDEIIMSLKIEPLLSVIRKLIIEKNNESLVFENNLYTRYMKDYLGPEEDFDKYRQGYYNDLNLIIEKIGNVFGSQAYSAIDIIEWLNIQINTNNIDDVPVDLDSEYNIILTTIHKSKGLEYDTVILPITHQHIYMRSKGFYLDYDENKFASNLNKKQTDDDFKKFEKKETEELLKEESRLLYVAITRAKNSLTIFQPKKINNQSFSGLLRGGRSNDN